MLSFPIFAGLIAAGLHVISGPDHLAAITPLAIETKRRVWRIGLFWGFGHLAGMLVIGILFLLLKDVLPLESISERSEQLVGVVLVGVGLWALFKIFKPGSVHNHPHVHDGEQPYIHVHEHNHDTNALEHAHSHSVRPKQNLWSSFSIGILHGLAGIAHFLLLLPVLGFESQWQGLQYVLGFALGTVLAMSAYAFLLGLLTQISKKEKNPNLFQGIRLAGGLFAIFVGIYWLYIGL